MRALAVVLLAIWIGAANPASAAPTSRFGASPEQVRAAEARYASLESQFGSIARENSINEASLRAIARELGLRNPDVSSDRFLAAIRAKAQEARALLAQISSLRQRVTELETANLRDPAKLALDRAEAAFNEGRLEAAETELAGLEVLRRSEVAGARDAWSAIIRRQADIAALRGDLEKMDDILRGARRQREEWLANDAHKIWEDEIARAVHWYDSGDKLGINANLVRAIDIFREDILPLAPRERLPLDWGATQNYLGNALWTLGRRENTTANLQAAVSAYQSALLERTRERAPLAWATTQNNLGNAISDLGERESSSEKLQLAVQAYEAALLERTRERAPIDWAMTQNNLGATLRSLGERENSPEKLNASVEAYRLALLEWTQARVPNRWAGTQNNLGNVLSSIGQRENSLPKLQQAIEAFDQALLERTRERVPLQWALTQHNRAIVYYEIARRENTSARLQQSIEAFQLALLERTRERIPLDWASSLNGLGVSLSLKGEREKSKEILESAINTFDEALLENRREIVPIGWALSINGRAFAKLRLAKLTNDCELANSSMRELLQARELYTGFSLNSLLETSRLQLVEGEAIIANVCRR